jgi:hypothetical protein
MVQPGDVIGNPVTGKRMTFLRASAQTGGALAQIWQLARNGMTNDRGLLKPLDAARMGLAHDMYVGRPPVPIPAQRGLPRPGGSRPPPASVEGAP